MVGVVGEPHTAAQLAAVPQGEGEGLGAGAAVDDVPVHRALVGRPTRLHGGGVLGVLHDQGGHLGHVRNADGQGMAVGVHGEVPAQAADGLIAQQGKAGLALVQGGLGALIPGAAGAGAGNDAAVDLRIAGLFPIAAHIHLELVVPAGADGGAARVQQGGLNLVVVSDAGSAALGRRRREGRGRQ